MHPSSATLFCDRACRRRLQTVWRLLPHRPPASGLNKLIQKIYLSDQQIGGYDADYCCPEPPVKFREGFFPPEKFEYECVDGATLGLTRRFRRDAELSIFSRL